MYHLTLDLSDVDRGVYEPLDLRLARHPSESARYLYTRAIAYALCYEEGITFTKGLCVGEEPAVEVRDLRGDRTRWIEVGNPSWERLHKASKATPRVAVFTYAPDLLAREVRGKRVHRVADIEVYALRPSFLDEVDALSDRQSKWGLTRNEGEIYLEIKGRSLSAPLERVSLAEE
jgi:uncharacterized protein YaeQ